MIHKNWAELIKPAQLEVKPGNDPARQATVVAEPLERGFGLTLGNALRYAGGRIIVDAQVLDGAAEIVIDDDGPGIPEAHRADAPLPFTAIGERAGHGMGLAIVDSVVRAHRGTLSLDDSPLGGLRVRVIWPLDTSRYSSSTP